MEPILDPGKEGINVPSGGHLRLKAYAERAKYSYRGRNKEKSLVG